MSRFYPPRFTAIDGNGNPIVGAKLNFYLTGTNTPQDTYSDPVYTVANTNPVVADADGRFGDIFLSNTNQYKVVFTDAADNTLWTVDPVRSELPEYVPGKLIGWDPVSEKLTNFDNCCGEFSPQTPSDISDVIYGRVDSEGTKVNGIGFTSSRVAEGTYEVSFDAEMTNTNYSVMVSIYSQSTRAPSIGWLVNEKTSTEVDIFTRDINGDAFDQSFTFIILRADSI